ncbi:hypothetical protein FJ250_00215 [bacterium]|nr:hypothetical protein [bacterium]
MSIPLTAGSRPSARRPARRSGRWLATLLSAWVAVAGGAAPAAIEFPGPRSLSLAAPGLSVTGVRLPGRATDDLVVGMQSGSLALVRYRTVTGTFELLNQLALSGRLVDVRPWAGRPAARPGVVVAAADPDQVLFVRIEEAFPYLTLAATVPLEEDPGTLAWFGDVPGGDPWLAVTLPGVDRIEVLADRGGWRALAGVAAGDEPFAVATADLDGDGRPEAVAAQRGRLSGDLCVLSAPGGDAVGARFAAVPGLAAGALAAYDEDEDGRHELVVSDRGGGGLVFLRADGDDFLPIGSLTLALPALGLTTWRLDDGTPALLAVNAERGAAEFASRAAGTWRRHEAYYPGCRPLVAAVVEADGDGRPDLACVGEGANLMSLMLAWPGPGFWGLPTFALDGLPGGLAQADFDGDGHPDVMVASALGTGLALFAGRSDGSLATMPIALAPGFTNGRFLPLALDADQEAEIAVLDLTAAAVAVLDRQSDGSYAELSRTLLGVFPTALQAGDIDGDGLVDLAVVTASGAGVRLLFGLGGGAFAAPVIVDYSFPALQVKLPDLDGDGDLEIVAVDGGNRLWWRLNTGGRAFAPGQWQQAGNGASLLAVGDLDGDLDPDVVVGCRTDRTLISYENRDGGTLVRRTGSRALVAEPVGLQIADFDGDVRGDIVVGLRQAERFDIYLGILPWNQDLAISVATTPDVLEFAVADINVDGSTDLLALDGGLQLGVSHLNLDPSGVALAPRALRADCTGGRLLVRLKPPPGAPWRLEARGADRWRTLADATGARAGRLEAGIDAWDLELDGASRAAWGPLDGLRLVVESADGVSESQTIAVPAPCDATVSGPPPGTARLPLWTTAPWPNPGNPRFRAVFRLPEAGPVLVSVHDLAGRRLAVLREGALPAGDHEVDWDGRLGGRTAPAGSYLLRVAGPAGAAAARVVLVK